MKRVNCKEKKIMRYLVARDVGSLTSVVETNVGDGTQQTYQERLWGLRSTDRDGAAPTHL